MNNFQEKIDVLSTEELLNIISSKEDYQEGFWQMAIENAEKRGLQNEVNKIVSKIQNYENEKNFAIERMKEKRASLVELYSEGAIITFTILFTAFAGSILFAYNLKKLKVKGSDTVIAFGLLFTIGLTIIMTALPFQSLNSFGYLLNTVGGYIIYYYFGKKYYPDKLEFKKKKIWKALIITSSIFICIIYICIKINQNM